jgi:hypothetical protein
MDTNLTQLLWKADFAVVTLLAATLDDTARRSMQRCGCRQLDSLQLWRRHLGVLLLGLETVGAQVLFPRILHKFRTDR